MPPLSQPNPLQTQLGSGADLSSIAVVICLYISVLLKCPFLMSLPLVSDLLCVSCHHRGHDKLMLISTKSFCLTVVFFLKEVDTFVHESRVVQVCWFKSCHYRHVLQQEWMRLICSRTDLIYLIVQFNFMKRIRES